MVMMRSVLSMVMFGSLVAVVGCVGMEELSGESQAEVGKKQAGTPKLNLSHIACTEDGDVVAHFVLLFNGSGTPGGLTGTYNGGSFGPISPDKNSGNVWHYNVILPAGDIEILSATVTAANGSTVTLHNPSEYSGNYACGPDEEVCPIVVEAGLLCTPQPLGNPGAECGHFGLDAVDGKIEVSSGTTVTATRDAYVAIVKAGNAPCGAGSSAYNVYVNVSVGDTLEAPAHQDISHVTYCACPAQ
jgi:hypothetical protein